MLLYETQIFLNFMFFWGGGGIGNFEDWCSPVKNSGYATEQLGVNSSTYVRSINLSQLGGVPVWWNLVLNNSCSYSQDKFLYLQPG